MSVENCELIFNWSLNNRNIEEKFSSIDYEPQEDVFEISDYIFQSHEVLCTYGKLECDGKFWPPNLRSEEALNTIIGMDELLLADVCFLKSVFSKTIKFNQRYFQNLKNEQQFAEQRSEIDIKEWRRNYIKNDVNKLFFINIKDVSFLDKFFDDLKRNCDDFIQTGNIEILEESVKKLRSELQKQADFVVGKVKELYQENLWKIIGNCLPDENLALQKFGQALDKMNDEYRELKLLMKEVSAAYRKIIQKGGCFAICNAKNRKIYALSGNDYPGSGRCRDGKAAQELDEIAYFLDLESEGFERAILNDQTKNYVRVFFDRIRFYEDVTLKEDVGTEYFDIRNYTCCERKIMSVLDSSCNNLEFFIRYKPCQKCVPAMTTSDNRKVISYVISEQLGFKPKFFISKVVIQDKSYTNFNGWKKYQYELNESIIVN